VDYTKGRVYIPQEDMDRFHVEEASLAARHFTPEFRRLMLHEVDYAWDLFQAGMPLIDKVDPELALDIDLFSRGGMEILRAIRRQNYDVLRERPSISSSRKLALLLRAFAKRAFARSAA
jgi:phytoene/squalene synthetase